MSEKLEQKKAVAWFKREFPILANVLIAVEKYGVVLNFYFSQNSSITEEDKNILINEIVKFREVFKDG